MTEKTLTTADWLEQALNNLAAEKKAADDKAAELAPELEKLAELHSRIEALPHHERRRLLNDAGLRHVSAAPKPITPLSGRGAVQAEIPRTLTGLRSCPPPRAGRVAPEWEYWRILDRVEEWEAAALSLNIEPRGMSFRSDKETNAFEMRLRIVESLPDSVKSLDGVSLAAFAAWAAMEHFDGLPPELVAMAHQSAAAPSGATANEAKKDPAYEAEYERVQSLYEERDELLAMPYKGEKTRKRLGELTDALRELEKPASFGAPENDEPKATSPKEVATSGMPKEGISETSSHSTEAYKSSWPTCTKQELIDGFLLTGKNWEDQLSRPSKFDSAKRQPGRKGKGGAAIWCPITFAGLLVANQELTPSQVKTRFLKVTEWKKWEAEVMAEIGMD